MQGRIDRLQVLEGKYGKFTNIEIGGDKITAYNAFHQTAVGLAEGDTVEYSYEMKGQYKNFTVLKKISGGAAAVTQAVAQRDSMSKDESMIVSYAKDLMVAGKAETPDLAVATIFELLKAAREGLRSNPTS